ICRFNFTEKCRFKICLLQMPLKQLAPLLYRIFGIEAKDCYRFYIDIKRRKNESRTYFLDRMQEKLNRKILRDEELERMRR
ncbi:RteC domain-containing protein, partial [Bacteroides intestinalis]|uniref:RteC domain-containing protein n=1 Tax=Bacteroides intestinalis TaxID=329854 RepID=UPI0022E72099